MELTKKIADRLKSEFMLRGFVDLGIVDAVHYYYTLPAANQESETPYFFSLDDAGREHWVTDESIEDKLAELYLNLKEFPLLFLCENSNMELTIEMADRMKNTEKGLVGFFDAGSFEGRHYYKTLRRGCGRFSGLPHLFCIDEFGEIRWIRNINDDAFISKHLTPFLEQSLIFYDDKNRLK